MSDIDNFLSACNEQKRLLGKMRMLWAYHQLYAVDDPETHPGAKEWHENAIEASENAISLQSLAKCAAETVRQSDYDPAILFELAESAGSWERFTKALAKHGPALKASSVVVERKSYPQPALEPRDKFIWENMLSMSMKKLKQALEQKKNFGLPDKVTSLPGFRKAASRYSQYYKLPTRTFRSEVPYVASETD